MNKRRIILIISTVLLLLGTLVTSYLTKNIYDTKNYITDNVAREKSKEKNAKEGGVEKENESVINSLDFTLKNITGSTTSLSSFKDKKVVVINFWATWCSNCKKGFPDKMKLEEQYKEKVDFIFINVQESKEKVDEYMRENGFTFKNNLLDLDGEVSQLYGISGIPTTVIINKEFTEIMGFVGDVEIGIFEKEIIKMISK